MSLPKKKFGSKALKREVEIIGSLIFFFGIALFGVFFAIRGQYLNFDLRNDAAGKTIFLSSGGDLQAAIDSASNNDAIFLRVGSYSSVGIEGFVVKNKNIRILGAGSDFVNVTGKNKTNVFHLQNSSVRFESIEIEGASENGVLIENGATNEVQFKSVVITNNSGAAVKTNSKTVLQTSIVDQNANGIQSTSGELIVENSFIENSAYTGIHIQSASRSNTRIQNTVIYKNAEKGIFFEGSGQNVVKNVTLLENGDGIIESGNSVTQITNTVVQDSSSQGISLKENSTVKYSSSSNNIQGNFSPASLQNQEGNMTTTASFDDNFRLLPSSPLKDKGAQSETDYDGTRMDIGAFGGNPDLLPLNSKPVVQSSPPEFIKVGETYNYEVKSSDPDNDKLFYSVLNTNIPKWLKIENNKLSGTPSTKDVGFSGVMLVVSDKRGHNIVHPVSINVLPLERAVPGTTTPTPTVTVTTTTRPSASPTTRVTATPTPTQTSNNEAPKVTFISPDGGSAFEEGSVDIEWEITNQDKVESVELKYSLDKENFTTITTLPATQKTYKWETKDIEPGKYVLKIEAKEKGTNPLNVAQISNEFEVKDVPKNVNATELVITKISPVENDVVPNFKPLIFVEYKPEDVEIDKSKTYLKANGEELAYKTGTNSIYFEPTEDFVGNKVQIETKIVATNGAEAFKKWTFSLPAEASPKPGDGQQVSRTAKILGMPRPIGLLVLGILIVGLFASILYFIVKLVRTIREERQGSLEAEFIEYYDTPTASPSPDQPIPSQPAPQAAAPMADEELNEYLAIPSIDSSNAAGNTQIPQQAALQPEPNISGQGATNPVANMQASTQSPQVVDPQALQAPTDLNPAQDLADQAPADPYIEGLKKKYGIDGQPQPTSDQPQSPQA